jgi:hypothetical protein
MTALTDRPRTARTVYGGGEDESSRPRTSHVVTPHSQSARSIVHLPQSRRRGERARESGKQGKQGAWRSSRQATSRSDFGEGEQRCKATTRSASWTATRQVKLKMSPRRSRVGVRGLIPYRITYEATCDGRRTIGWVNPFSIPPACCSALARTCWSGMV